MRELTDHIINPADDNNLTIEVLDEPGAGGASHAYEITGLNAHSNASFDANVGSIMNPRCALVLFQNGPIPEVGVNGVTHEVLLAIVADRLRSFQAGPYACAENADALAHTEKALESLLSRTRKRMQRGVEGTHTV